MRPAHIGYCFFYWPDVDFVTPLCSQVVYEGLVDDIFRIKCGKWNIFFPLGVCISPSRLYIVPLRV